jgi:MoaA/NifB/PqqE/SkfB family radical SAM enzyme
MGTSRAARHQLPGIEGRLSAVPTGFFSFQLTGSSLDGSFRKGSFDRLHQKLQDRVQSGRLQMISDFQLNVYNFDEALQAQPNRYSTIRFDPNNTCNLHCVYCHNHRSDQIIDADRFRKFLSEKVQQVDYFQVGCIMEPTLDRRLTDFLLAIASSAARPTNTFMLQTNGILLHTHDTAKIVDAGLTNLSVSLDVADPQTQKELRSGMSLAKVVRNIENFRKAAPDVAVEIISVVTTSNISQVQGLVDLAINLGVRRVIFRELLYYPDSNVVDHARMRELLLRDGEFQAMADSIKERFTDRIEMVFAPNDMLDASARLMLSESRLKIELSSPQFHQ